MSAQSPQLRPCSDPSSMLSRHFGRGLINYFSGTPLNRLSFLRNDTIFLRSAFTHPTTNFILLKDLLPALKDKRSLALFNHDEIKGFVKENPWEKSEEQVIKEFDSTKEREPLVLFLGMEEGEGSEFVYKEKYRGQVWFAVDVTNKTGVDELLSTKEGAHFMKNPRALSLKATDAAIYAHSRTILDWNARNKFCAGCGSPTISVQSGYKRICPSTDLAGQATPTEKPPCATRHGVSNLSFPRYDPVMIAAVVSADGEKVLLGRQARYPKDWYSTLAGFVEVGESVEDAVVREVWEEAGVRVGRVVLHSTQPWPFPASLMIGAVAQALPGGETIDLGNDAELQDAKWYPIEEVRTALKFGTGPLDQETKEGYQGLRLPPHTAIAHQLLKAITEGFGRPTPNI